MQAILLFLILVISQFSVFDWTEVTEPGITHYKLSTSAELRTSKWVGYPDQNYKFEGNRLAYERTVKDDNGKDVLVKTYRDSIEIIADFKPDSKVYGFDNQGAIERAAVEKFGSSLKGFVWIDKVVGGGEVVLPFTAPRIFIATGDRLNPKLTEIGTDSKQDNYYEIIEGKTRVFVKSFSGVGGTGYPPDTLIAHWKMNEDTADDSAETIDNGDFSEDPGGWTLGDWTIADGNCSCAADGNVHSLWQNLSPRAVFGQKYVISYEVTANSLQTYTKLAMSATSCWGYGPLSGVVGKHSYTKEVTIASPTFDFRIYLTGNSTGGSITIDDVSVKLYAVEDSSGNDHDGLAQQDTDVIHRAGKVGGAFDFTPNDYIEIADHDDFTPAGALSISAWVNMHDATDFTIASKGVEGTDGEWRLYTDSSDKLFARKFDESIDTYIGRTYDAVALSENKWLHIVFTSDGGTLSSGINLYVDGVDVDDDDDESATFEAVENLDAPVYIGRYDTDYADGLMDNVTIYSQELDQTDVNFLYNDGKGREDWEVYLLAKNFKEILK